MIRHSFSFLCVLQYVVIPTRRSTAEAFQILFSHALGDAGSPYLVGQVCVTHIESILPSLFLPLWLSVLVFFF